MKANCSLAKGTIMHARSITFFSTACSWMLGPWSNGFHPVKRPSCVQYGDTNRPPCTLSLIRQCVYGFVIELSHDEVERLYAEPSVAATGGAVLGTSGSLCIPALCFNLPFERWRRSQSEYRKNCERLPRLGCPRITSQAFYNQLLHFRPSSNPKKTYLLHLDFRLGQKRRTFVSSKSASPQHDRTADA